MKLPKQKPVWLRKKIQDTPERRRLDKLFDDLNLHTVCREAGCPNRVECFSQGTATFLILGNICTRACVFCGILKGVPGAADPAEPQNIAHAVKTLGLRHAVITAVTRDDLADGGASHFSAVIKAIKAQAPGTSIEVLVPDFGGNRQALGILMEARPDIVNHNIETVPRLYPAVRPQADFTRSLNLLIAAKMIVSTTITKSGLMVGMGETENEVIGALHRLREARCDIVTIGQYLAPSRQHMAVQEYITPDQFEVYKAAGFKLGFSEVCAGPFVRSSYHAALALEKIRGRRRSKA